jgi:hypothetical protein
MEAYEIDLRKQELAQAAADYALDCAVAAVYNDCSDELDIVASSIIHYAEEFDVDVDVLRKCIIDDYL